MPNAFTMHKSCPEQHTHIDTQTYTQTHAHTEAPEYSVSRWRAPVALAGLSQNSPSFSAVKERQCLQVTGSQVQSVGLELQPGSLVTAWTIPSMLSHPCGDGWWTDAEAVLLWGVWSREQGVEQTDQSPNMQESMLD